MTRKNTNGQPANTWREKEDKKDLKNLCENQDAKKDKK
jgi:hypothetical protein